jgi:DnaK suppressor protein
MQKAEWNRYKEILKAKEREFSRDLHRLDRLAVQKTPEVTEEAQMMVEQDLAVLTRNQEMGVLRQIWEALDRIAAGNYGTCLSCERAIPSERLKALPWAALCIHCQETLDREQTKMPLEKPAFVHTASSWRVAA